MQLATRILDLLGKPHSLIRFVPDRPAHDYRYSLDSRKLEALGWRRARGLGDHHRDHRALVRRAPGLVAPPQVRGLPGVLQAPVRRALAGA